MEPPNTDSPPPGWESTSPSQHRTESPPPPGWEYTSPSQLPKESPPPGGEFTNSPPPGWESTPTSQGLTTSPPPVWGGSTSPAQPLAPEATSPSQCRPESPEMGQMICGICRSLLSYPKGALHVKCPGCQTINHVLEAHEVGLVKCGSCSMLLMYKYESPSVRCSCCRFVTEIGVDNKRPLISVQPDHPPSPHVVH